MAIINALNRIKREAGIKKCLIVEGNVSDVYLVDKKLLGLKDCLRQCLEEIGYTDIVTWDRISGIQGDTRTLKLTDKKDVPEEGDSYDLGDVEIPDTVVIGQAREPGQMLAVIHRTLSEKNDNTAFILDWSEYLFNKDGQLDPQDREQLTMLGKTLKESLPRYRSDERGSAIILISTKASMLPLSLYSGNPEVNTVTITKPDMEERRDILRKVSPGFFLKDVDDIIDSPKFEDYVDMLNDFTGREIIQMANMSRQQKERITFEKLFALFKYGEKDNPWEKLSPDKVRRMKKELKEKVIGQDQAIDHVYETIVKAFMGITGIHKTSSRSMPKGVFFFVGPTGVGKTELSKAIASFLFGDENACIRFDMSEYSQQNSDQKLIGAPPGYVGFEEGGQLTNAIREKPFSVVLFDEIEKAAKPNPRILDIFLQILEDGRLTDNRGVTTYFSDTIIIFTSNLGAADVVNNGDREHVASEFVRIVKDYFDNELKRPEILGRIGYENIIPFNFIDDPSFATNILKSKLRPVQKAVEEKYGITLKIRNEQTFYEYILEGADIAKGGRDVLNALNSRLLTDLALYLFTNYEDLSRFRGCTVYAHVNEGKLEFDVDD